MIDNKSALLLAGCGELAQQVAALLADSNWICHGLRRNTQGLPAWIKPATVNLLAGECPQTWPQGSIDYVLVTLAADERSEQAYRQTYLQAQSNLYRWLEQHQQRPRHLIFVSSTAVYAQDNGQWLDEDSPAEPQLWSGRIMRKAEQLAQESGIPATLVRLAGIYGGKRQAFLQRVRQGYHAGGSLNRYTNRIHERDAAALLAHLLQLVAAGGKLAPVYLGVDDCPVEQHEVVQWLQQQLAVQGKEGLLLGKAGSNKKCSNALAKSSGWQPHYTDFRQGYLELIRAGA